MAEVWAGAERRAALRKEVAGWAWLPPPWWGQVDEGAEVAIAAWAAVAAVSSAEVELAPLQQLADILA